MVEFGHPARVEDFLAEPMGMAWDWNKLRAVSYTYQCDPIGLVSQCGRTDGRYSMPQGTAVVGDSTESAQACIVQRTLSNVRHETYTMQDALAM
jgi:hypothetical protein